TGFRRSDSTPATATTATVEINHHFARIQPNGNNARSHLSLDPLAKGRRSRFGHDCVSWLARSTPSSRVLSGDSFRQSPREAQERTQFFGPLRLCESSVFR